jgi:hypothetical protein
VQLHGAASCVCAFLRVELIHQPSRYGEELIGRRQCDTGCLRILVNKHDQLRSACPLKNLSRSMWNLHPTPVIEPYYTEGVLSRGRYGHFGLSPAKM